MTVLLILGFLIAAGVYIFWQIGSPFVHAGDKLRTESVRLELSNSPLQGSIYTAGSCLDNCPVLHYTYHISPIASSTEQAKIQTILEHKGYKINEYTPRTITAWNKNEGFDITVNLDLNSASLVSALDVQLEYYGKPTATNPNEQKYCDGKPVKTYAGTDCAEAGN